MDRDLARVVASHAQLQRLDRLAGLLSGWVYLFAVVLALRLVGTAAERQIEHDRPGPGTRPDTAVFEHFVTAAGGRFTYRVLASTRLADGDLQAAIQNALEEGRLNEPEAGGTATLVV